MKKTYSIFLFFILNILNIFTQMPDTIQDWHPEKDLDCEIHFYKSKIAKAPAPAILICPGGGYSHLAMDHEGLMVAKWFNTIGIHAFVIKYDVGSLKKTGTALHPIPLKQAAAAIAYIKMNAQKFEINNQKTGIMGFSAGGHLASSVLVHYNNYKFVGLTNTRPDYGILGYPVISFSDSLTHRGSRINLIGENYSEDLKKFYSNELHIDENTPSTFIFHSADDQAVSVGNSIEFYKNMLKNNVSGSLHIFSAGGHGYGIYNKNKEVAEWTELLENWLIVQGIIE
jgi:acetyl esterase/lipase